AAVHLVVGLVVADEFLHRRELIAVGVVDTNGVGDVGDDRVGLLALVVDDRDLVAGHAGGRGTAVVAGERGEARLGEEVGHRQLAGRRVATTTPVDRVGQPLLRRVGERQREGGRGRGGTGRRRRVRAGSRRLGRRRSGGRRGEGRARGRRGRCGRGTR